MDISFESKSRGIRWNYQVGLTCKAMLEESGGTIEWTYHSKVKAEVSGQTIRWDYLLKVKQQYQVELSGEITSWKQWWRYQEGLSSGYIV